MPVTEGPLIVREHRAAWRDPVEPNGNDPADVPPGTVGLPAAVPGDPDGLVLESGPPAPPWPRSTIRPSPWSGWPADWQTPNWYGRVEQLTDTAWTCLDLNSSVLATMPPYLVNASPTLNADWLNNPDPDRYASWHAFARQLFWDYQMGESFVLPMAHAADGYPMRFRVVPPWLVNVEMRGGTREYMLGRTDVTSEILHIRYQSNTADARGHGPLEVAGARMTAAGMLQRYANKIAETGGTPMYWMEVDRRLNESEANDLLDRWVESRIRRAGEPALVSGNAVLKQATSMSARDMTLLELAQFNEARIAVALGVPPFLAGLPSGGDSMTYSNVSQLFDFHDRASLRPKATAVMSAMSGWVLPRGQTVELNRDEYSRPSLKERAESYKILIEAGVMRPEEARTMERLNGPPPAAPPMPETSATAALSLTGGDDA